MRNSYALCLIAEKMRRKKIGEEKRDGMKVFLSFFGKEVFLSFEIEGKT